MSAAPEPRFARSGNVHVAYVVVGSGPVDIIWVSGFVSNLELMWTHPLFVAFIDALASFSRLIIFDKRGTGLSDRVPDDQLPDLDTRMDDVRAVMDAAGSERAFLLGQSEGGPMAALFSATYPARTRGVIFYGSDVRGAWAPDHPWGMTVEAFQADQERIGREWGSGEYFQKTIEEFAPSAAGDPELTAWIGRYFRMSASPGAAMALNRMWFETDIREIARHLAVPSLVVWRKDEAFAAESRWLAANVPGAIVAELPGRDHLAWLGDSASVVDEICRFVESVRDAEAVLDRAIATVMFVDIVDSTRRAAEVGDTAWRELLTRHRSAVRAQLARFRGTEIDTAGDGFLATFEGPARAVRCAEAIRAADRALEIEVRTGVHTGEVQTIEGKVGGLAVHIGARVGTLAGPGEILVSQTVKDLTAGSGLVFEDAGEHELKGVPDHWRLYGLVA
jgi:class 3 adenylate cyclase